jgi:Zn-dependent peptidase ImmA (M78 family)
VVLTPDRADDVYRYRFTAAHELGHLLLHGEAAPGDTHQEREADAFAAEFLTPRASILPNLPARAEFTALAALQRQWGVSAKSLLYRCREIGLLSSSAASRAYQRLNVLQAQGAFRNEPISGYAGERPALLAKAFDVASRHGLTANELADELAWPISRLRALLNLDDTRPPLHLVT